MTAISTNVFRALRELLPEPALQVATVSAVNLDGTLTVDFPGGGSQRVRGAAAVSDRVFVRNGVVEGLAPALTPLTIEV
jgi:hypothetical protein